MSQETPSKNSSTSRYYILLALIIVGLGVVLYYAMENSVALIWRILGLVAVVVIAFGVVYLSDLGKRGVVFVGETRTEVRKVIWPTRQETMQMSLIVFVSVILVGLFLWLVDSLFLWMIEYLTGL